MDALPNAEAAAPVLAPARTRNASRFAHWVCSTSRPLWHESTMWDIPSRGQEQGRHRRFRLPEYWSPPTRMDLYWTGLPPVRPSVWAALNHDDWANSPTDRGGMDESTTCIGVTCCSEIATMLEVGELEAASPLCHWHPNKATCHRSAIH